MIRHNIGHPNAANLLLLLNLDVPTSIRNGVSIQPSNFTAYQDEIVTFVCNVDHEGEIIIEWFKNGHKLKNKDRVSTIDILKNGQYIRLD